MNKINIVWTAVSAALMGIGCIAAGLAGNTAMVLALGLTSISMALLSGRDI